MQLKHIKEIIKNKNSKGGSNKNNYKIGITAEYKNIIANRKFKLALRDSIKDITVNKDLLKTVYRKAKKAGYTKQQINKIGCLKLIQLLK